MMNKRKLTLAMISIVVVLLMGCSNRQTYDLSGVWKVTTNVTEVTSNAPDVSDEACQNSFLAQSQTLTIAMTETDQQIQGVADRGSAARHFKGRWEDARLEAGIGRDNWLGAILSVHPLDGCVDTVTLVGFRSGNTITGDLSGVDCNGGSVCTWQGDFTIEIEK
jgi:hypothetical protein